MDERVGRDLVFDRLRVAFAGEVTDLALDGAPANVPADLAAAGWMAERARPGCAPDCVVHHNTRWLPGLVTTVRERGTVRAAARYGTPLACLVEEVARW
jgi:hypothetical protein